MSEQIYCSNCGQLIPLNSNFCRFCGAPQHGEQSALYRAQSPRLPQAVVPAPTIVHTPVPEVLPQEYETLPRRKLAPAAIGLFFINYIARTIIIIPALLVGAYFELYVLAGLALYFIVLYLIAAMVYDSFTFEVKKHVFEKSYGIVHKHHVGLPYGQIHNVNITRTFIDRMLGIARLDIETAGSSRIVKKEIIGGTSSKAEAHLPGVTLKDAKMLHDLLLARSARARHED